MGLFGSSPSAAFVALFAQSIRSSTDKSKPAQFCQVAFFSPFESYKTYWKFSKNQR